MYSTKSIPLNNEYPDRDVHASGLDAERTSPNKVHRLRPGRPDRSSGVKNTQVASGMKRSVEQLASNQDQLARKQDLMAQAFAALQAAEQDIKQNISALAPLAPKSAHVPPAKPPQSAAQ